MSLDVARHDPKQKDTALLVTHIATAHERVASPERRDSIDALTTVTKCFHQPCYEREKQSARELQRLRDSFGALKLEKDKEIAFLRDQLAAYTALSKSPVRVLPPVVPLPVAPLLCVSVGVQTTPACSTANESPLHTPHVLASTMYSITTNSIVRTMRLDRHASLQSVRALAAATAPSTTPTPADDDSVASRVATALADPALSLRYVHSQQFGADLVALSTRVGAVLAAEPRVLQAQSPVHVLGDIHGNSADLRFFADTLWPRGFELAAGRFVFLGDYVDRGTSSLECVAYLFSHKLLTPHKLLLLRGNHETRAVNGRESYYGPACLLAQCTARFGRDVGISVWHAINDAFDRLPLAAVIDNDVFCVHGGVPRPLLGSSTLDAIDRMPVPIQLDELCAEYYAADASLTLASDLLWGDPAPAAFEAQLDTSGFGASARGGNAISYGDRAVELFLKAHGLSRIVRAHEATRDGVAISKRARVVTVFSTSKDHGLGDTATCGCLLVDSGRITAMNRALLEVHERTGLTLRRRSSLSSSSPSGTLLQVQTGASAVRSSGRDAVVRVSGIETTALAAAGHAVASRQRFQIAAVPTFVLTAMVAASEGSSSHSRDGSESTDDEDDEVEEVEAEAEEEEVTVSLVRVSSSSSSAGRAVVAAPAVPTARVALQVSVLAGEENDDEEDNNQHDE